MATDNKRDRLHLLAQEALAQEAATQESRDTDFLSPESIEETLCGRLRGLREDELFDAMDCMGEGEADTNTTSNTKQEVQTEFQPAKQVRRARGY